MREMIMTLGCAAIAGCNLAQAAPEAGQDPARLAAAPPALVINEVAAAGSPDDWFEVVNIADHPVDLSDFVFVDHRGDLARARRFPGFVLAPGERHVQSVTAAITGFQLGRAESLFIYREAGGALVAAVRWAAGASPAGGSYARVPDKTGVFRRQSADTRGAVNDPVIRIRLP